MKPNPLRCLRLAPALLAGVALLGAACGGGASSTTTSSATVAELRAAAPTSASVDLDVAGASAMTTATSLAMAAPDAAALAAAPCHPHLFSRTADVVWRLNAVFFRILRHVEALITRDPSLVAGDTATWTQSGSGVEVQRQLTVTRSTDGGTYTFELQLAPAGQAPPSWVTVLTGSLAKATTSTGSDQTAQVKLDYDALASVVPSERFTGQISLSSERIADSSKPAPGVKKTSTVTFTGFSFGPSDPHGKRDGTFDHVSEPGVGGSLSFADAVVLLCPANPSSLSADALTQSRWYKASDGSVHGRADTKATGGQIPAGEVWMGLTCYQGANGHQPMAADESSYWLMKLEDASGATLQSASAGTGASACDPAFGSVPSLADDATDYGFPSGPVSFPNEW